MQQVSATAREGTGFISLRQTTTAALLALLLCSAQPLWANAIPYGNHQVAINAQDMPIAEFLLRLFRPLGVQVVFSPNIKGVVSGNFEGPVEQVYGNLALAFNLVEHFDGTVLRIGNAQASTEKSQSLNATSAAGEVKKTPRPVVVSTSNTAPAPSPVQAAARLAPSLPNLAAAPQPATDVRVFHLRRASAQDVSVGVAGRQVVLPGVASTVRSMMGASSPDPASKTTAAANTSDTGARIEAHARLNAVLVRDLSERMPQYEKLITMLDVEPQAIEIETTFIDFNTTQLRKLGITWRYDRNKGHLIFGKGDDADIALTPSAEPNSGGGFASAVLAATAPFMARMQALQAQGLVKITPHPQALTFANVEAVLENGQTFYLRPGRDESSPLNVAAGTSVRITPQVMQDAKAARIKLTTAIEDRSLSNRLPGSMPVLNRASVSAQAVMFEGESLLVGGIIRDSLPDSTTPPIHTNSAAGTQQSNPAPVEPMERMVLIAPRLVAARAEPRDLTTAGATPLPARPAPDQNAPGVSNSQRQQQAVVNNTARPASSPSVPMPTMTAPALPSLRVQDRRGPRESYLRGESYEIEVAVSEPGYLYCYLLDVQKKIGQFFPNPQSPNAAVTAGSVMIFPGASPFSLVAARRGGRETVLCLQSPHNLGSTPSLGTATDSAAIRSQFERLAGAGPGKVQAAVLDIHAP